jgi:hypothetical protein
MAQEVDEERRTGRIQIGQREGASRLPELQGEIDPAIEVEVESTA